MPLIRIKDTKFISILRKIEHICFKKKEGTRSPPTPSDMFTTKYLRGLTGILKQTGLFR